MHQYDEEMTTIKLYLEELGYKTDIVGIHDSSGHVITLENIYAKRNDSLISVCAPHSGNGFKFLLRADSAATHDRWSNCDFEWYFQKVDLLMHRIWEIAMQNQLVA